jgi:hypothetical protein
MNKEINVSLTQAQYQKAKILAAARDITVSALIRELIYNAPLPKEERLDFNAAN